VKRLVLFLLFFFGAVGVVNAKTTGETIIKHKDGTYELVSGKSVGLMSLSDGDVSQPNYVYELYEEPDQHRQWYLDNEAQMYSTFWGDKGADIEYKAALKEIEGTSLSEIVVAVLDTGVDYSYADLKNMMWNGSKCVSETGTYLGDCIYGYNFSENTKDPMPKYEYHGSHVAGIIAAQINGTKMAGIASNVKIMALRADSASGGLTTLNLIRGIEFATKNGAKIINASWGTPCGGSGGGVDYLMKEAIANFPGIFINAAGNGKCNHDDPSQYTTPSEFRKTLNNMMVVAASDAYDNLAYFSDFGGGTVDVAAPGVHIYSIYKGKNPITGLMTDYDYLNGTSMATPVVCGVAAAVWGMKPSMTREEVTKIIKDTVDKRNNLNGFVMTNGRVNLANAVRKVKGKDAEEHKLVSSFEAVNVDNKARNFSGSNIIKGSDGNPVIMYCDTTYTGGGVKLKRCNDFECKSMTEEIVESGKCNAVSAIEEKDGKIIYIYSTPDNKVTLKECSTNNCSGTKSLLKDLTKMITGTVTLILSKDEGGNLWVMGISGSKLGIIEITVKSTMGTMSMKDEERLVGEFELDANRGQNDYSGLIFEGGAADEGWVIIPGVNAGEKDILYRCDISNCLSTGISNEIKGAGSIAWNSSEKKLWFLRASKSDKMWLAKCDSGGCGSDVEVNFEMPDKIKKDINGVFLKFEGSTPWIVFSMWNEGSGLYFLKYGVTNVQMVGKKVGFGRPQAIINGNKIGILYTDLLSNIMMYKSAIVGGESCPSCKSIGDYNCDGIVNGLDYTWWKQEFVDKLQHEGKWQASHICSLTVSSEDYSRWRFNYLN